ncbi:hypothetical protein KJ605_00720 [Patescibacteria group bacterium]|nr:hypothetical protein [Patescibacteria group bacterium]
MVTVNMSKNLEIPNSTDSASELLKEYRNDLVERVISEGEHVHKLLADPPQAILIHVYGAEKDEDGTWVPNIEGHYAVRSAMEFIQAARRDHPEYSPVILTAGGLSKTFEGNNISRIYCSSVEIELTKKGLADVTVTDEQEFVDTYGGKRLAADTRGELTFLDKYSKQNAVTSTLSIGRIEHGQRIQRLLDANNIEAEVVSVEGILAYFHPEAIMRFVQRFSEIIESEQNFSEAEKKKLLVMLIDRKGTLLEAVAALAGPLKSRLFKAIGQEEA